MANNYGAAAERFSQGYQQLLANDYLEAVATLSEAIELFPVFETAFRFRAEAYRNLGLVQEADADMRSVVSISKDRQAEAERVLKGKRKARSAPGAGLMAAATQSPIILWTGVVSVILVIAGVVVIIVGGQ